MNQVAFDTLKLAKRLEEGGFAPNQAAATASAMGDAMTELLSTLVTKPELAEFRADTRHEFGSMRHDFDELRAETRHNFELVRHDFELVRRDLAALELRMTIKLGTMIAAAVGLTTALVKLL